MISQPIENQSHILDVLQHTEIFRDISRIVLAQNLDYFRSYSVAEGEMIIKAREIGHSIYIVISGSVAVHHDEYIIAKIDAGLRTLANNHRMIVVITLRPIAPEAIVATIRIPAKRVQKRRLNFRRVGV